MHIKIPHKASQNAGQAKCNVYLTMKYRQQQSHQHMIHVEMWANAQRDGRPAEYRWRPLFNAAVWLCSNAAKTRNPLKFVAAPPN